MTTTSSINIRSSNIMSFHRPWLAIIIWWWSFLHLQHSTHALVQVQVCRNKGCCKRSPDLLQIIADLLGKDAVQESGCLAQCEQGPNVQVQIQGQPPLILHELEDATAAAVQLELVAGIEIPKLFKAAAKVLERASLTEDGSERERLVTSVIVKLTTEHPKCTALAHALAVRARTRVELKDWQGAIDDAQIVILGTLREEATESSVSTCYRVWADSEEQLNHKDKAVAVLQDWQKAQPLFRTKLQREVHDLMNP